MTEDQWYFAYGSNLYCRQKEQRTGCIRQAVSCRLAGYRFAFNKRGRNGQIYANIVPDHAAVTWGVVYLCNPAAIREMDQYEGVSTGNYKRLQVKVARDSGETVEAITYIAGEEFVCEPGPPSADYLQKIVSGARHHGLPEEYIGQIESLAKQAASVSKTP